MYEILITHDVEVESPKGTLRWAYANRSLALQKYAPPGFRVTRASNSDMRGRWEEVGKYDLFFNLDYACCENIRWHSGKAVLVCSFNRDSHTRREMWDCVTRISDWVVVNNYDRWSGDGVLPNTCCISNGVDTDLWYATRPIAERPHRVVWTGGTGVRKAKGYYEIMEPAAHRLAELGFEISFRPVTDIDQHQVLTQSEMLAWYNDASYVLCVSESEGTPNYILEGMACGCVPVTTNVGNVREFGCTGDRQNAVVIERSIEGVIGGLVRARENRERISAEAHRTMHEGWSYGDPARRADYYFRLFRALIERGPKGVRPFCYMDGTPEEVCP